MRSARRARTEHRVELRLPAAAERHHARALLAPRSNSAPPSES
jgi:hypothetical protein